MFKNLEKGSLNVFNIFLILWSFLNDSLWLLIMSDWLSTYEGLCFFVGICRGSWRATKKYLSCRKLSATDSTEKNCEMKSTFSVRLIKDNIIKRVSNIREKWFERLLWVLIIFTYDLICFNLSMIEFTGMRQSTGNPSSDMCEKVTGFCYLNDIDQWLAAV